MNIKIRDFDWSFLMEASETCRLFNNVFIDVVSTFIPSKTMTAGPVDTPWYDSEIRTTLRKSDTTNQKATKPSKHPIGFLTKVSEIK